jgi:hypothetical protein
VENPLEKLALEPLVTDSIIYIPVIWFFVAKLGALFFIKEQRL